MAGVLIRTLNRPMIGSEYTATNDQNVIIAITFDRERCINVAFDNITGVNHG